MKQHGRLLTLILLTVLLPVTPVRAQGLMCHTDFEAITTLRAPRLGAPSIWDAVYMQPDKNIQLASGVPTANGTVLTLGRTLDKKTKAPLDIVLAEVNGRGRITNEKTWPAKQDEQPAKIIALKDGYVALTSFTLGDKKDRMQARLTWYTKDAAFIRSVVLQDDRYDYEAVTMAPAGSGSGFIVALHATSHGRTGGDQAVLARFSDSGGKTWQRTFSFGASNEIMGLAALGAKGYLATGRIALDGRDAGWAMQIDQNGIMQWQRTYPRGGGAVLRQAAMQNSTTGQAYIVGGDVKPAGGGGVALWLMALDIKGTPLWQRYIKAPDYSLSAAGLMTIEDSRIIAAGNAHAIGGAGNRDHIRLLAFSPRGDVLSDEAYIEGLGAHAGDFVRGANGQRVITATIDSDDKPVALEMGAGGGFKAVLQNVLKGAQGEAANQNGWIVIAAAPPAYTDACIKP